MDNRKKDFEERDFGREKGVKPSEIAGKMVFLGDPKPNKHKQAKQPKQKQVLGEPQKQQKQEQ